jgi:hypothetical protein
MYKKLFTVLSIVALISSCKKDDGGGNPIVSIAIAGYQLDSAVISIPNASASLTLNYATVSMANAWKDTQRIPTNTAFVGASYMSTLALNMLGQNLPISRYYLKSSSKWSTLGDDYGNNVNINLAGNAATIANGTALKTPEQLLAKFPVTYLDSFKSSSSSSLNISVTTSGMQVPVTVTQTIAASSKNYASGSLLLNGYVGSMNTIVQKYTTTITTTVKVTGILATLATPIINQTLTQYGFNNGQLVTSFDEYRFWVDGKGNLMTLNGLDGKATVTTGL